MAGQGGNHGGLVRLARPDERLALEALQFRASTVLAEYRDQIIANPDAVELPAGQIANGQVLLFENGGAVWGFVAIVPDSEKTFELDGLFVEPGHWGKRVGETLVNAAKVWAIDNGAEVLDVIASPSAAPFYARYGFMRRAEVTTRFGPAIAMRVLL